MTEETNGKPKVVAIPAEEVPEAEPSNGHKPSAVDINTLRQKMKTTGEDLVLMRELTLYQYNQIKRLERELAEARAGHTH